MSANTLLTSVITGGSNNHTTTAEEANAVATDFINAGVVGTIGLNTGSGGTGSFCVNADASPDMGVTIKAGQAYVSAAPSGQNAQTLRVRAAADYTTYTINANASGSTKYDWVYLTISAVNANTPSADGSNVASFVTSRSSSNTADNGTPPTYGIPLAVVTVANGASSITNSNIQDKRTQASVSQSATAVNTGWVTGTIAAPTSVTANGNRSYSLLFSSVDYTGTISPGMRLRTTRTTAAPTQCTSLNGTTQYYSKTSPAGMTFTDDFTVSAWIKPTSYANGVIASRYNGTSGWVVLMNSSGQLIAQGFNAGSANVSQVTSYQSVPLNKWTHVALQLDMSAFTATTLTSYTMIDGVDVPAFVSRAGTNPTALIQAGNLEIGSDNGGLQPFPGKLAQVAIYSAKVTQATILASMHQGLAGTETSLISAYSFNNSFNDLNANANNLTANGSAVATNADSPFGGQAGGSISSTLDYGIVQSATFSTNTTVVVQVPEGCTIPTSGGVSAVSYSTNAAPYGFPKQRGKWQIEMLNLASQFTQSSPSQSVWYNLGGLQISVPIGEWDLGYSASVTALRTTTGNLNAETGLSTANNSATEVRTIRETGSDALSNATFFINGCNVAEQPVSLSAATVYYLNVSGPQTGVSTLGFNSDSANTIIVAKNAHL